jgi:hypothetical protein
MPSDYLNQYRERVNKTSAERLVDHTKQSFIKMFIGNPNYRLLSINGIQYETLYSQGKNSDEKSLLFIPNTKVDIGSVVELNSNSYLIMDFQGEGINEIYPSATLKKCNNTYPIKLNKTSQLKGHNQLGKPVYEDVYSVDKLEPCIVESGNFSTDTDSQLVIPKNTVFITLKYQLSDTVNYNYEFTMYNNKYKIKDIDYTKVINEKGIIKLIAERV